MLTFLQALTAFSPLLVKVASVPTNTGVSGYGIHVLFIFRPEDVNLRGRFALARNKGFSSIERVSHSWSHWGVGAATDDAPAGTD